MTDTEYKERKERIYVPLLNAYRNKCMRTARARLRDLARLVQEQHGYSYEDSLATARGIIYDKFNIIL